MQSSITAAPEFIAFARADLESSIPARFARQVARYPARLAVKTPELQLTFEQLDQAANAVAWALRQTLGEGEAPVALLFHQGAGLVVAIVGTLKAGRAYVCLDPDDPPARRAAMLQHAGAAAILTQAAHRGLCTAAMCGDTAVLEIDALAPRPGFELAASLGPERLAYLFYTSGSTGTPKGVYDDHRNVLHNVMRYTNALKISAEDRLTLLQSGTFSATVSSLFCGLLNGACLYPIDPRRAGFEFTANWLAREAVTVYHSVPAIFEQMLGAERRLPGLRVIRLEGDQTFMRHVRLFRERFERGCVLAVGLGATETGLSRQFFIDHDTPLPGGVVPIGYATEDMEVNLLDEHGREVPPGEPGQIAVRSRYLARGYWNDPARTRAAFLPAAGERPARTYLSGDMGRLRADGCLEYLGRVDFQVKIRGVSVSLPAVEEALSSLAGVRQAVVMAQGEGGRRRLVGYLVSDDGAALSVGNLRRALADTVPRAMIPSKFVLLRALPLDRNGKVDRRALPAPDGARPVLETIYAAPRSAAERRMAALWERALELEPVGIHDDFFDLGGDSLLATLLLDAMAREFGVTLPQSVWLDRPTVAGLVQVIESRPPAHSLVALRAEGWKPAFFCVHAHRGQVLDFALLAQCMDPARPFHALQARGLDGRGELLHSVEDMAREYLREIRTVQPAGPYLLGGWCFGALIALEMARQLEVQGERALRVIMIDPDPVPGFVPPVASGSSHKSRPRRNLAGRLRETLPNIPAALARRAARWFWRLLGYRRRWLPRALHASCLYHLHQHATQGHRLQPYAGAVVILCSRLRDAPGAGARGWDRWLTGLIEARELPCNNSEILVAPHVRALAQAMDQCLDAAGETRLAGA